MEVIKDYMETKRRQYSEEFKKEAVEYSLSSGKTAEEVAQDLGISPHNLKRWRAQYRKRGELAFHGHGRENLTPQEEKVRRL
jgi:transposase